MGVLLDSVEMLHPSVRLGLVGDRLAGFQVAEEMQNLELELISSKEVSAGPENACHLKEIDCQHTVYEFEVHVRGRF